MAPTISITATPTQWKVDDAWMGYVSNSGTWSPRWCNSGEVFITTSPGAGNCVPIGYTTWAYTQWPVQCIGQTAIQILNDNYQCTQAFAGNAKTIPGGNCNTNSFFQKSGDQTPLYVVPSCHPGTGLVYFRDLPTGSPPPPASSSSTLPSSLRTGLITQIATQTASVESSTSALAVPTSASNTSHNSSPIKLFLGLGLGLGIPFFALVCFFCCSYRKISISIRHLGPEAEPPPPPYQDPIPNPIVRHIEREAGKGVKVNLDQGKRAQERWAGMVGNSRVAQPVEKMSASSLSSSSSSLTASSW